MSTRISLHGNHPQTVQREVTERFSIERVLFPLAPRYNIASGARIAVITQGIETGARYLEGYNWGLIPFWAQEADAQHKLAFARSETLDEKPAFRQSFATRRCLIPANGFFQFKHSDGEDVPLYIRPKHGEYFAFAGIWDEWISPEGFPIRTVALITTEANRLLAPLGQRIPAILRARDEADWLHPAHRNLDELQRLLQPVSVKEIEVNAVSSRVNFENFNQPQAIEVLSNSQEILKSVGISTGTPKQKLPPRKRLVRREYSTSDGQVFFKTRSFSRDEYLTWHPVVDIHDGHVFCDCPDFRFRHAPHEPRIATPQHWCKHINRAVRNCRKHGELR